MKDISIIGFAIIIANFIITQKGFKDFSFFNKYRFIPKVIIERKEYLRMVLSGFLHVDWTHFIFNMLSLYFFSEAIEATFGIIGFLFIYFASLLGGNLLSLIIHKNDPNYSAVGASGAVSGIVFAFIAVHPGVKLYMFMMLPIPAWIYGILFVAISIFGMSKNRDNIGHDAHLGGAIIGMLAAIVLIPGILSVNLYVILGILIPAVIFLLMLIKNKNLNLKELFANSKKQSGYSVDDLYNMDRKSKEEELNDLLEKVSRDGYHSLTSKEKERLSDLSQ